MLAIQSMWARAVAAEATYPWHIDTIAKMAQRRATFTALPLASITRFDGNVQRPARVLLFCFAGLRLKHYAAENAERNIQSRFFVLRSSCWHAGPNGNRLLCLTTAMAAS